MQARRTPASSIPGRRFSLRFKFLALVSVGFIATGLIFGWVFSTGFEQILRLEFQKRGETVARALAANSRVDVFYRDVPRLTKVVEGALEDADVVAVSFVYDFHGEHQVLVRKQKARDLPAAPAGRPSPHGVSVDAVTAPNGGHLLYLRAPVIRIAEETLPETPELGRRTEKSAPPDVIGSVEVAFSLAEVERRITDVRRTTMRITGVIVGVGIVLVVVLSRVFVTPIERIAATARRIAAGDRRSRASVRSNDEIGDLADAFNAMTQALAEREEELRRANLGLEQKVRERTAELELKQEQLLAANAELERASRLKSEFLANMSHELRTPLNAVNGFSELLLEQTYGPLTAKQKRYVENILSSGRHLLQLINDILDLSKIEAGRLEVHLEEFSLRQAVESAASVIQPLAQKKGLTVERAVEPGLDTVRLDPGKMKQILYNLMSNAVKFTDRGKIVVSASRPKDAPREIEIVVQDTGIGIRAEDQGRIFREFEQVDGSHARRYEGTGLGLSLSRKLVEIQGGTIRVESELGRGSRFIVRMPAASPPGQGAPQR